jgi:UDP-3-O-[3-hydroxymyristoyl] glucosamine N-acyltransferase
VNLRARTLADLARLVDGRLDGDGDVEIHRVASIEEAGPGDITLLTQPRFRSYLPSCKASAVIVENTVRLPREDAGGVNLLRVAHPYVAFARILAALHPPRRHEGTVSSRAVIDPTASLGKNVTVFPHVYIGPGAKVKQGTVLYPGVFLGNGVEVGEECILHSQVTVYEGCRLGDRVIIHAGVVIGSDGFGYAGEGAERVKIPQIGVVEIHDDVEIGANCTIDRATLGKTVIGAGTKIDNLVHIAHNVTVGKHSLIIAQTGVAGSTRIGNEVILAGQVGVLNHLEIGDRAKVGPKSGVAQSIPAGAIMSGGIHAVPHDEWRKTVAVLHRLPKLWSAVLGLKRKSASGRRKRQKGVKTHARHQGNR